MKVLYVLVCDYALMSVDHKPSIMGVFGRMNVQQLPALVPQLFVAFGMELTSKEIGRDIDIRIEVIDPKEKPLAGLRGRTKTTLVPGGSAHSDSHQIVRLPPFPVQEFGKHRVLIYEGDAKEPSGQVRFEVIEAGG